MAQISSGIFKYEFNCLFNLLEKRYQIGKTKRINFTPFVPREFLTALLVVLKKTEGGTFRSESIVDFRVHIEPDVMIENEIRGEKGPVDARINARER